MVNRYVKDRSDKRRLRLNWLLENWGIGNQARKAGYLMQFGPELNHPEARYYSDVAKVSKTLEKAASFKAKEIQADLLERAETLYQRALDRNQVAVAVKVLDLMAKVSGCTVEKVEVSLPDEYVVNFQ